MILGPISLLDCLVFCIFLLPQLFWNVGVIGTLIIVIKALPFLCLCHLVCFRVFWRILFSFRFMGPALTCQTACRLPYQFVQERYLTHPARQTSFVQASTIFEDFVVRCVRYAFKHIPPHVSRVFFSKHVSLPFLRWRMLRHGYLKLQTCWREYTIGEKSIRTKGIWIMHQPKKAPDFVLYYVHGGGFCMGSSYFYLEFLMAWHHLLLESGFNNPAIFALEYTLVPDDVYPRQVLETLEGYRHVLEVVKDGSRVCVAGDSAGGALVLSLLLELGAQTGNKNGNETGVNPQTSQVNFKRPTLAVPRLATLISPWVTLMSNLHYASNSDFLNRRTLWAYAHAYAGEAMVQQQPASPGNCVDDSLWKAASPERGYSVIFGEEEVFAPDIEDFMKRQAKIGVEVEGQKFDGGIHAWPVASLFLSSSDDKRLQGLRAAVREIRKKFIWGR